ncbi:hypothetical protein LINPERPRIM_LOCUS12211 [Linum perenne]
MYLRRLGNYLTFWIRYALLGQIKSRALSTSQPSALTHRHTSPALGNTFSLCPNSWSHLLRGSRIATPTTTKPSFSQPNGCSRYAQTIPLPYRTFSLCLMSFFVP